ncbi:hypothetical protein GT2_07_01050 [Parageobacillus thermoglucosidasius NBRC 107763]|nr:hypothetical protein GT2_07_01050 [Parageobacillus thermoglucosidasius NBRC 107763]
MVCDLTAFVSRACFISYGPILPVFILATKIVPFLALAAVKGFFVVIHRHICYKGEKGKQ